MANDLWILENQLIPYILKWFTDFGKWFTNIDTDLPITDLELTKYIPYDK